MTILERVRLFLWCRRSETRAEPESRISDLRVGDRLIGRERTSGREVVFVVTDAPAVPPEPKRIVFDWAKTKRGECR